MNEGANAKLTYENPEIGKIISITYFVLGTIISKFVPAIHAYAWMIILAAEKQGI